MAEAVSDTKEDTQAVKNNVEDIKESAESLKEAVSEDESNTTQNKNFFDKVKDDINVLNIAYALESNMEYKNQIAKEVL